MTEPKPNRGGARQGAGRKSADGASDLVAYSTRLTPEQKRHIVDSGGPSYLRALIESDMTRQK